MTYLAALFERLEILLYEVPDRGRNIWSVGVVAAGGGVLAQDITIRSRRAADRKRLVEQLLARGSARLSARHEHALRGLSCRIRFTSQRSAGGAETCANVLTRLNRFLDGW